MFVLGSAAGENEHGVGELLVNGAHRVHEAAEVLVRHLGRDGKDDRTGPEVHALPQVLLGSRVGGLQRARPEWRDVDPLFRHLQVAHDVVARMPVENVRTRAARRAEKETVVRQIDDVRRDSDAGGATR